MLIGEWCGEHHLVYTTDLLSSEAVTQMACQPGWLTSVSDANVANSYSTTSTKGKIEWYMQWQWDNDCNSTRAHVLSWSHGWLLGILLPSDLDFFKWDLNLLEYLSDYKTTKKKRSRASSHLGCTSMLRTRYDPTFIWNFFFFFLCFQFCWLAVCRASAAEGGCGQTNCDEHENVPEKGGECCLCNQRIHWQRIHGENGPILHQRLLLNIPVPMYIAFRPEYPLITGSSPIKWVERGIMQPIWSDHKPLNHCQYIFRKKTVLSLAFRLVSASDHLSNTGSGPVIDVYSKRQFELHYSTDLEWSQAFKPLTVHLSKESCAAIGFKAFVVFRSLE